MAQRLLKITNFAKSPTAPFISCAQRNSSLLSSCEEDGPYTHPSVVTNLPGPKSAEKIAEIKKTHANAGIIPFMADFEKSKGNYIVDADGNIFLDVLMQISSIPLGYNHAALMETMKSDRIASYMINRPAMGLIPPVETMDLLRESLLRVKPRGLENVIPMMCGTCSVENAVKASMIKYRNDQRGTEDPTPIELDTCMRNEEPGTPNLVVLSFQGAFHGRTLGALSMTRTKDIHRVDIPLFNWPAAPFPRLRYPLEDHVAINREIEDQCLAKVRETILDYNSKGRFVAACVAEPIQSEGGDNHASPRFFNELQRILKEFNVAFIVDEVQTGGGPTGTFWHHESWNLPEPPDIVTFSKKMLVGGYYFSERFLPKQSLRIFNTWMGDPARTVLLKTVIDTIEKDDLIEKTVESGRILLDGLKDLQRRHPEVIQDARGVGTYCAVTSPTMGVRDQFIGALRRNGLMIAGSGNASIRFRPALIFNNSHAELALDIMRESIAKIKN